MIGAVVGTFTSTITLFLLCYCLRNSAYFQKDKRSSAKIYKRSVQYCNNSLENNPNMTGLLQYTPNSNKQSTSFSAINHVMSSTATNNQAICNYLSSDDSNTQSSTGDHQLLAGTLRKKPSYATYEPVTSSNNNQNLINTSNTGNTIYSDCQTYDLPTYNPTAMSIAQNQNAPTPMMPLPPIPNDNGLLKNGGQNPLVMSSGAMMFGPAIISNNANGTLGSATTFSTQDQLNHTINVATLNRFQTSQLLQQAQQAPIGSNTDMNMLHKQMLLNAAVNQKPMNMLNQ